MRKTEITEYIKEIYVIDKKKCNNCISPGTNDLFMQRPLATLALCPETIEFLFQISKFADLLHIHSIFLRL